MIWGGARAKAGKKKLNGYSPRKKKTQLNNPEKKLNSRLARKKKAQRLVAKEKKKLNANSQPEAPPRSLMVRP